MGVEIQAESFKLGVVIYQHMCLWGVDLLVGVPVSSGFQPLI